MATVDQMVEQVLAHIESGRPMWEVMRDEEKRIGAAIVLPGERPWLRVEDWDPTITVSERGREVRLVALLAREPGKGALRRTVAGIIESGQVPVIVAPTFLMRQTMKRWGWFVRHVGSGWDHEEQWRPRKGWTAALTERAVTEVGE